LTDAELIALTHEEISFSTVELLRREPFFGHLLSGLPRHITTSISTLAVSLRGDTIQLIVNPLFFTSILKKREHRHAVIKHEVLHIVFKHLFRIPHNKANPLLWNIACDLVVNQYVSPFKLPEGAINIDDFPEVPPEQTAEYYFAYLEKLHKSNKKSESKSTLNSYMLNLPTDHSLWIGGEVMTLDGEPVGSAVSDVVTNVISNSIDEKILKAAERSAGHSTTPWWLEKIINQIAADRRVKVDWKRALRIFAASSAHTKLKPTFRKESRRFESIPGLKRYEGLTVKKQQKIVVVVDTSGSVDDDQIEQFFTEIRAMYKNGTYVEIVECDAEVKRNYQYKGRTPNFVIGRGGTDFDPAFKWIRESGINFDGCIYLTDGYADSPKIRPGCRVLWVISGGEGGDHLTFGRQLIMDI